MLNPPRNLRLVGIFKDPGLRTALDLKRYLGLLPFLRETWEIEPVWGAPAFDSVCTLNWIVSNSAALPLKLMLARDESGWSSDDGELALPNESPLIVLYLAVVYPVVYP